MNDSVVSSPPYEKKEQRDNTPNFSATSKTSFLKLVEQRAIALDRQVDTSSKPGRENISVSIIVAIRVITKKLPLEA